MQNVVRIFMILIVVLFSFAFVLFFLDNLEHSSVSFLWWKTPEIPKALLLLVAFLSGLILGKLAMLGMVFNSALKTRAERKRREAMQVELDAFRRRPFATTQSFVTTPGSDQRPAAAPRPSSGATPPATDGRADNGADSH